MDLALQPLILADGPFFDHIEAVDVSIDEQSLYHRQEWAEFLCQQPPTSFDTSNASPKFVSPSALSSVSDVPSLVADQDSSISTQNYQLPLGSPISNHTRTLSSPRSFVLSPGWCGTQSATDPSNLSPTKDTECIPTEVAEPPKRRRGRPKLSETVTRTKRTAVSTMSRRKPKSSHRTPTASVRDTDDLRNKSDDVSDKTDLTRARNRKAAYKCRQKKKSKTDDLQSQATEMERTNADLHSEAAILRGEVFELKNMILQHSECECSYITEYIYSAAKNLAQPGMKATASVAGETSI